MRAFYLLGLRGAALLAGFWLATAHAGLFDDEEARRAILDLRQRIESVRQASDGGVARMLETQNEVIRRSTEESAALRRSLLDLQNQIESLRADVARLNGQGEQVGRDVQDLQKRQAEMTKSQQDLARGVEDRVRQLEPAKVTVDGREISVEPAERRAYEAALASFRAGDFVSAQSGFLTLLSRYPKSGYAPSALFWLGNAQYATRDYKEAITNFRILLTAAPDHLRAPEALLSIANCQTELKDARGARKTLEDLGKNYPQSEAAEAGKERLARLR